jgi:hypothetical protein
VKTGSRRKRRSGPAAAFLESYITWREACQDVRSAYRRWLGSGPRDRGLAFAAYLAALEREERASTVHCARAGGESVVAFKA